MRFLKKDASRSRNQIIFLCRKFNNYWILSFTNETIGIHNHDDMPIDINKNIPTYNY